MTSLQGCLTHMLTDVVGGNGQPLDLSTVLQECVSGPADKHYEFIGQAALELAISTYLRNQFMVYASDILQHMRTLVIRNQTLARAIAQKYRFYESNTGNLTPETVAERVIGIVQDLGGSTAVLTTIVPVLSEYAPRMLSQLPRKLRQGMGLLNGGDSTTTTTVPIQQQNTNGVACVPPLDTPSPPQPRPIAIPRRHSSHTNNSNNSTISNGVINAGNDFAQLVKRGDGAAHVSFEERKQEGRSTIDWGCRIAFRMTKASGWHAHLRYGQTKKKAKLLVLHDILNYYQKQPDQEIRDRQPVSEDGQMNAATTAEDAPYLPIDASAYYHEPTVAPSPIDPAHMEWHTPIPDFPQTQAIHIPDKRGRSMEDEEEYTQHMMHVLLGDFPRISLMEEQQQQQLQDGASKRHKVATAMDITTTSMMDTSNNSNNFMERAAALLPESIHPPSLETMTAREVLRKMVDLAKIDKMLSDPVQAANPKSSMFSYVRDVEGLKIKSEFEERGPAHSKVFEATASLHGGGHSVEGRGVGLKKSEAEQIAIMNLMKYLVQ
ncbi:hypothetical protein BDB00DRAFT_943335 [Zychaea mexicana]|uniref:uncharacterized protein n=1 Tax=Zychaea mexicana TaxID=64656 RepID=UPI0022FE63BC|nr:uncharacterized protein BDB00DRAFT_943335 [Zychaea mexicana]KAI9479620.1 hypothetical protein BDB00DRAFT_943335 [Zychaea mexicana]